MNAKPPRGYLVNRSRTLVIEIVGADAAKVINNMTTNDFARLELGGALETFITDVRGWCVAHGIVVKQADRVWLLGSHPDASRVAAHIDRYIIREDARVVDRSAEHGLLWWAATASQLPSDVADDVNVTGLADSAIMPTIAWGPRASVDALVGSHVAAMSQDEWEWFRISHFWPSFGADIPEKCIPQEVDRTTQAISFTKGCYLGQETIARLDARGQLQKKLCLVELKGIVELPAAVQAPASNGDAVGETDKEIGHLTSVAGDPVSGNIRALAYLRRGSFNPQQAVRCGGIDGKVLAPSAE